MTAAGFVFSSLRRFTQILREMINEESFWSEYPKINMGASNNPKIARTVVADQSPSNTYE